MANLESLGQRLNIVDVGRHHLGTFIRKSLRSPTLGVPGDAADFPSVSFHHRLCDCSALLAGRADDCDGLCHDGRLDEGPWTEKEDGALD